MANILLGISGSIAAYKSILLLRELTEQGHQCKVVLTKGAQQFVTTELIAGLGCEVYTEYNIDLSDHKQAMLHINLARWAERFIIAPISASTIAKLATGIADNLLGMLALAYNGSAPIYIAPAMNQAMWANSIVQQNISTLKKHNFVIWEPQSGIQACGENGMGRMLESDKISELIQESLATKPTSNKTLLITLGATIEPIDPVRYISNHSSGKMGIAIVNTALALGMRVIAVCGKTSEEILEHSKLQIIKTSSALEMLSATQNYATQADIFIAVAAVCDYRVAEISPDKIKKNEETTTLQLIKNPDIVSLIKKQFPALFAVGFAAETTNLIEHAQQKLLRKQLNLIIANDVSNNQIFNHDTTSISIINQTGVLSTHQQISKSTAAQIILQKTLEQIAK